MKIDFDSAASACEGAAAMGIPALGAGFAALPSRLFEHVLDHIDYGIACVDVAGRPQYLNRSAREVWPKVQAEREPLRGAIRAAATRGERRLVDLRSEGATDTVAVVPLAPEPGAEALVLLVLGKHSVCERLSSYWYGVARGLTSAEQGVLEAITAGCSPRDIADRNCVSLATVRTQIASLRGKTGADNLYALLRELAQLPPIRCAAIRS